MRPPKAAYIPRHGFSLQMSLLAKPANNETLLRIFRGKCMRERKNSISVVLSFYWGLESEIGVTLLAKDSYAKTDTGYIGKEVLFTAPLWKLKKK
jgi:hypothetical protein